MWEGKAVNDDQRKAVAEFMFNLAIGCLLTLTVGPVLLPDPKYSTLFLAAIGFVCALALFIAGYRLLR